MFPLTEAQEGCGIGRYGQHLAICFVLVLGMGGQGPAGQEVCRMRWQGPRHEAHFHGLTGGTQAAP